MAINLQDENLIPLGEATAILPRRNGKRLHVSTLHRWTSRGVRGVRLETLRLGGLLMTSQEALQRFTDRLAGSSHRRSNKSPSRAREIQKADSELTAVGI